MAIALVREAYVNVTAGGAASVTFSLTNAVSAGDHLIVMWAGGAATGATLATNASGATAQTDVISGTTNVIVIGSIYAPNGISTSDTITVTLTAGSIRGILCEEFSGLDTSSWLDKTAGGSGTGTSLTSATTAATVQAAELAIGAFVASSTGKVFTKDANYSYFTTSTAGFGTTGKQGFAEYRILATAGTQVATATWNSGTQAYNAAIATYKEAAAAAVLPPRPVVVDFAVARASNY